MRSIIIDHLLILLIIAFHCDYYYYDVYDGININRPQQQQQRSLLSTIMVMADWDSWWTYEGISGPDFWGRLNPKWSHCSKGRRQSPIDIDTELLIYDQYLRELYIKGDYIDGNLINTGRSIEIEVDQKKPIIITGGPLSYQYTLSNVTLHFGRENNRGSEHSINQLQFSGELQFYGYNGQLYSNWSEAKRSPNGLVAIATMIKMTKNMSTNAQLKIMINSFKNISNRGDIQQLNRLNLKELLSDTKQFVTYEGSLTQPACFESVQWIILNKPLYISGHQLHQLRTSLKSDGHQDNFRPIQQLNNRMVTTNIINHRLISDLRFKYDLEEIDFNTDNAYSKQLCYVNQPVAYKASNKRIT
ncbi:carbonic anhydrase-related protein 10-like [Dermatophagoides farinae]|uniref:Carbonic anhydrase-related protein 10-like n=1 Tax=Dermatophagoides farinae TaxID=6954 RepID=A0A9D4SKT5_DERFA|nr:carbonic anhydrase-related protein 10-like [Dermatophagoides farinae]KAH7644785.1 carbonic anhydrase-related protein 10-like [Dermatophagoides farinae]